MRRLRGLLGLVLSAFACAAPESVPVKLPGLDPATRMVVLALERADGSQGDGLPLAWAVARSATGELSTLPTLEAYDGVRLRVTAVEYDGSAEEVALAPGELRETAGSQALHAGVRTWETTVEGDRVATWAPGALSVFLSQLRFEGAANCPRFRPEVHELGATASTTGVVTLDDGSLLVTTTDPAHPFYRAQRTGEISEVRVEVSTSTSVEHRLFPYPWMDPSGEIWFAAQLLREDRSSLGELWRGRLDAQGGLAIEKVATSTLPLFAISVRRTLDEPFELFALGPSGELVRFDGAGFEVLYRFPKGPEGTAYGGGTVRLGPGHVIAVYDSGRTIVEIDGGGVRDIDLPGRGGLGAIADLSGLGAVLADGSGKLYRREEPERWVELEDHRPAGAVDRYGLKSYFVLPYEGGVLYGGGIGGLAYYLPERSEFCPPEQIGGDTILGVVPIGDDLVLLTNKPTSGMFGVLTFARRRR